MENTNLEVVINHNGRAFKYKFSDVCIEGGEFAREIGEFKAMQMQNPPKDIDSIVRSNGFDWLARCCAMIFVEYKNFSIVNDELTGEKTPFNFDFADSDVRKFFGTITMEHRTKLRQAVEDFFYNIGLGTLGSQIFQSSVNQVLSPKLQMLAETIMKSFSKGNDLSRTSSNEQESGIETPLEVA